MAERGATWATVVGGIAAVAAAAPGVAGAAPPGTATMFSDPGDYIGQGQQRVYRHLTVAGGRAGVSVGAGPFSMEFAPAPGRKLKTGVYDHAERAPFREDGHPGIDISGDGRGCNEDTGRFEVRSISIRDGKIRRLWIVYEQHCEGGVAATFGEVRIGGIHAAAPAIVRWPTGERGKPSTVVPVTFAPRKPIRVARAFLTGRGRHAFLIRLDECSGRTASANAPCQVWVRFQGGAGTRRAHLKIASPAGRRIGAQLQGFNWGGRTRLVMHSDPGDYIGAGANWSYAPSNATIAAGGSRSHVGFSIDGAGGDWWYGDFSAGQGDILARGSTYRHAARDPFRGSSPGLEISGNGRGCNTLDGSFTVTDARFDASGALHNFGVNFEQHCEHSQAALHGTFEFRAGDHTRPAQWMRP